MPRGRPPKITVTAESISEDAVKAKNIHYRDSQHLENSIERVENAPLSNVQLTKFLEDCAQDDETLALLKSYFQEAKEIGAQCIIEECLVVARHILMQEARKTKRDNRSLIAALNVVSTLAKQVKEMEDLDIKVARVVQARMDVFYNYISEILISEVDNPELLRRIIMRVTGKNNEEVYDAELVEEI